MAGGKTGQDSEAVHVRRNLLGAIISIWGEILIESKKTLATRQEGVESKRPLEQVSGLNILEVRR